MPYIPNNQFEIAKAYIKGLESKVKELEARLSAKNKEIEELKSSRCDPYIPEEDPYQN
jgi:hypothetical protein